MSLVAFTDEQLLYSQATRCRCGAGMAYPLDPTEAMGMSAWQCADMLKGTAADPSGHDRLPFAFYKVREETSINSDGRTTRPAGTMARTIGKATCPECKHSWESAPYAAPGAPHHWFGGPCPSCGYKVGAAGSWSSTEGPAIEHRYRDVVLPETGA